MKLPFGCETVRLLIDFAYDQQLPPLDAKTKADLQKAAECTVSQRLTAYLKKMSPSKAETEVILDAGQSVANL